jgi:hypothetical protein
MKLSTPSRILVRLAAVCCLAGLPTSQAQMLALHTGAHDPTTEGFTIGGYGQPQVGPVPNDLGLAAWHTSVSASQVSYTHTVPVIRGADWLLSISARALTPGSRGVFRVEVNTGQFGFGVYYGSTTAGDPTVVAGSSRGSTPEYVLAPGSPAYHSYQLSFSAATETASFWIDGVEQYSGLPGTPIFLPGAPNLRWAASFQSPGPMEANWHLVSLEIIPEPSAGTLLALGAAALLLGRPKPRQLVRSTSSRAATTPEC